MEIKENLSYTNDHEWIKIDGNTALVGITDFAQSELGDIVFIEVETIGEDLNKNEVFGTVEAVKTVSELYSPISGQIIELNLELEQNPDLVNDDPYGSGWIIKIRPTNQDDKNKLMNSKSYSEFIE